MGLAQKPLQLRIDRIPIGVVGCVPAPLALLEQGQSQLHPLGRRRPVVRLALVLPARLWMYSVLARPNMRSSTAPWRG